MLKKQHLFLALATMLTMSLHAQHHVAVNGEVLDTLQLNEVVINSSYADDKTPMTTSELGRTELQEIKLLPSLPYMIELEPSVVVNSENGMVGANTIRIRGVDATRINVNINGITLNDAESQSVYWYNIPNLGGMAQSIQLQRGVGASSGGSASFGGAMNLQTFTVAPKPYAQADLSYGSFNTRQYGITAGTGRTKHGFAFDAAYNGLNSNGFQRGGKTDQQSLFLNAGWYGQHHLVKAIAIIGEQHSGITWDGATAEQLDADPHYNGRGKYYDAYGNVFYYDNETDNYRQQHYQLYYSYMPNEHWNFNAALNYTHGFGYTESYKNDKKPKNYGMADLMPDVAKADFIVNKDMLNDAYSAILSARYQNKKLSVTVGANYLYYDGSHYGEVIWSDQYESISRENPFTGWYRNLGDKHDATAFAKLNYDLSERFNLYADLQVRYIAYSLHGTDDDYGQLDYDTTHLFFNPKIGLNFRIDEAQRLYAVAGISNREPARADIKEALYAGSTMKHETMLDVEVGYKLQKQSFSVQTNLYAMLYKNQLTPNGFVTESNYALMENVDKSYRLGMELAGGYRINRHFSLDGNLTLSINKIIDYTAMLRDVNWELSEAKPHNFGNTDLALSPSIIAAGLFTYRPVERCKLQLVGKYVGKQYADNTSLKEAELPDYFLFNARGSYTFKLKGGQTIECKVSVNNILNKNYRTSAWCGTYYDPADNSLYTDRGYFQQPGINFMAGVSVGF